VPIVSIHRFRSTIMTTDYQTPSAATSPDEPSFIRRRPVRMIIYAGLGVFLLMAVIWPLIAQLRDPDFQRHVEQHRVMVGMTKDQVLKSWGGPQTINTSFTNDGVRREEWIFEDWDSPSVVRHRYLYFEEGVLIGGWFEGSGERTPMTTPADSPHPKLKLKP
jgi:hypothetical protein